MEIVFEQAVSDGIEPGFAKYLLRNPDAVIEHMKPVIRDWMDENLPSLLSKVVREQVATLRGAPLCRHNDRWELPMLPAVGILTRLSLVPPGRVPQTS